MDQENLRENTTPSPIHYVHMLESTFKNTSYYFEEYVKKRKKKFLRVEKQKKNESIKLSREICRWNEFS